MRRSSFSGSLALLTFVALSGCVSGVSHGTELTSCADPCASDDYAETVGCNDGFASGEPAPSEPAGTCTSDEIEQGSCAEGGECVAGRCMPTCTPGDTWVTTGSCPGGFRCHALGGGWCFRDCDDQHACPTGMQCASGMCMPSF